MYVRCEKKGFRIEGEWVAKGCAKKVKPETVEALKPYAASGQVSMHTKDPKSKSASARKAKKSPGLEAIEKEVKETKSE